MLYTVSQVVHDYGDICQAITELAGELQAPIAADDFGTLNRCLDDAIASAVTEFGRNRRHAGGDEEEPERQRNGFFTHELRNLVNTATVAFGVLKTGNVGIGGSTAAIVDRSLNGLRTLIARSVAEVRLTEGIQNVERILVPDFVDDVSARTALEASADRAQGLFRLFEQRGTDRSGVGVGLAFSRWGTEANNGRLYTRNTDTGCVFTVDLPRSKSVPAAAGTPALRH